MRRRKKPGLRSNTVEDGFMSPWSYTTYTRLSTATYWCCCFYQTPPTPRFFFFFLLTVVWCAHHSSAETLSAEQHLTTGPFIYLLWFPIDASPYDWGPEESPPRGPFNNKRSQLRQQTASLNEQQSSSVRVRVCVCLAEQYSCVCVWWNTMDK